jgi:formamidopyrimidine-DNA glycosylase
MPELPEVEITARRIGAAVAGLPIESAMAPGINALKTFDPPLSALEGRVLRGVSRRGKMLVIEMEDSLAVLIHLMSAGRLQLFDKRAGMRDRTSRLLLRLPDDRELRLREFGTKQRAWVKVLPASALASEESVASLGPEAWPSPPSDFASLLAFPRPLHGLLRDQHVIAGIGRSWVDEILHAARLSPFKPAANLTADEVVRLHSAVGEVLEDAVARSVGLAAGQLKAEKKTGMRVHGRTGETCPVCGDTVREVSFADRSLQYCPTCQTGGQVLADRRLSRLLK